MSAGFTICACSIRHRGSSTFLCTVRHGCKRLFVFVENETIRAIADRVRFNLDAFAQRFDQHRPQLFRFHGQKSRRVRRIGIWLLERCATRTERAVRNHFDGAESESITVRADRRTFVEQARRAWLLDHARLCKCAA